MTGGIPNPLVAKFGGTSMARPEAVALQLEYEHNTADVVIVSAPGKDSAHSIKATDMLLGYKNGSFTSEQIQQRFADILDHTLMGDDPKSLEIIEQIPAELSEWASADNPVEALGEHWSARLFAAQTGRTFVDAREIIFFDRGGKFNQAATFAAVKSRLGDGGQYVVPGFFGSRPDGSVQVFERGGSDISGAIIASALQARQYDNWSDVDGFKSADPRKVPEAQLLSKITYREARELGNGGSELLHRQVIRHLGGTGIKTVMKQTFGPLGNAGTQVMEDRGWQWQPIIGVTGRDNLTVLNLHEFGLNEGIGETLDVIIALQSRGIPYEHSNDATDDVAIFVGREYRHAAADIAAELSQPGRTLRTNSAGLIHVVGEGLAHSGTVRLAALGAVATALAEAGIEGRGASDVSGSATLTIFVKPQAVTQAVVLAHQALRLDKPQTTS